MAQQPEAETDGKQFVEHVKRALGTVKPRDQPPPPKVRPPRQPKKGPPTERK